MSADRRILRGIERRWEANLDTGERCACGHSCEHGPHESDLDHSPERVQDDGTAAFRAEGVRLWGLGQL